jgi:hypothetical protein
MHSALGPVNNILSTGEILTGRGYTLFNYLGEGDLGF